MAADPPPPAAGATPASGPRTPQQLYTLAGLALGAEQAAQVFRAGPHDLVSIMAIDARAPVDPVARGPFLAGVAEGILRVVRQLQVIGAPHGCGLCDGPLEFDRMCGEYATFTCTRCGQWHTATGCCHVASPPSGERPAQPDQPWPVDGPAAALIRAAEANAAAVTDTLDGEVHAVASEAASRVNNGGVAAQVLYLLEAGMTVDHLRSLLTPVAADVAEQGSHD